MRFLPAASITGRSPALSARSSHRKGLLKRQPHALERPELSGAAGLHQGAQSLFLQAQAETQTLRDLVKEPILELGQTMLAGSLARVGDGTCFFRRPRLPGVGRGTSGFTLPLLAAGQPGGDTFCVSADRAHFCAWKAGRERVLKMKVLLCKGLSVSGASLVA